MIKETINELKKYTLGKKNTEKVEISVLQLNRFIKALEQEPSGDLISRQAVLNTEYQVKIINDIEYVMLSEVQMKMRKLPSVKPQTGHCKDCKYFEYDSVAKVDGIPLIVAHEICNKWGDGCKTREDGYCFLFEPNMSENPTSSDGVEPQEDDWDKLDDIEQSEISRAESEDKE